MPGTSCSLLSFHMTSSAVLTASPACPFASCPQHFICLQVLYQVEIGHADDLLADLHEYLLSIGKNASVSDDICALVCSMVQSDVECRATAQQALQSLQVLAPSNKARGRGIAI